ncbi:Uncharacterised protein [Mycobacteroides abscessus subsp. abscessus]|nr:Uncharacterised protein [Mycobacteroides abscessus subsp. abscessus]
MVSFTFQKPSPSDSRVMAVLISSCQLPSPSPARWLRKLLTGCLKNAIRSCSRMTCGCGAGGKSCSSNPSG